ncbi:MULTISPECIES: transcription termination factor Rho [Corynebacterium]|uniref:transcription termination factor Rho n=1 Tax=Corynebacterium TaxID=1716 RepID=UPI00124C85F9|nr:MULTISPECIES: transcription termination factor Rho [Corynebacterium]
MTDKDTSAKDLNSLRLPELRAMARDLGLRGLSGKRKVELVDAIKAAQNGAAGGNGGQGSQRAAAKKDASDSSAEAEDHSPRSRRRRATAKAHTPEQHDAADENKAEHKAEKNSDKGEKNEKAEKAAESSSQSSETDDEPVYYESRSAARRARRHKQRQIQRERRDNDRGEDDNERGDSEDNSSNDNRDRRDRDRDNRNRDRDNRGRNKNRDNRDGDDSGRDDNDNNDDQGGNRRNRRDRNDRGGRRNRRDRNNRRGRNNDRNNDRGNDGQDDNDNRNDDQLQPVGGILDIVDNNVAFVRTTGYQAGTQDVFVNQNMIRKNGLRRGDAITGQAKVGGNNRGNNRRQKYNPLVRVDTVNGMSVDEARQRPDFSKLTPLYPNQRLRLETEQRILTTRVIDLIMPIGKGQRALIVSPPKAGKTTILQNIANAIATNNPECYLMVVLVDERPEEVTDMQRSVKGEVIASTFDRPPSEHTAVAELAIERAKRLVEQGEDVVVLLDSITRLGRAYNNSSPASGRILSGGVDSNALYPPKRFLGAARNIENGGSLTIIATAMVETGSAGDTVIFEEFKGTGNAELKLDRKISERRVFPAVDVNPSGTRKDELLLAPEEARIMHKLRRILSALDNQQAIDLLIKQLKKTKNNGEFMVQVASSAPMAADQEEEYS